MLSIEIPLQSISITINQDQSLQEISDDAIHSAALSTEATATFMFLPTCNKRMTRSPCAPLYDRFPHLCKFLGSIPSDQLQIAKVPFWNNIQTPFPKHTRDMHIIAIWNTEGRNCLNACNKNWLKSLPNNFLRQSGKSITFIMTLPLCT